MVDMNEQVRSSMLVKMPLQASIFTAHNCQKVLDFCTITVYDKYRSGQLNIVCHFRSASGMVANVYDLQVSRRF